METTLPTTEYCIHRGHALRTQIAALKEELAGLEKHLCTLPPGSYRGEDSREKANVILPSSAIKPSPDAVAAVRKLVPAALFGKMFERVVAHKPVKGLRDVAAAILTPAKAAKVIALCEVPGAPYVRW